MGVETRRSVVAADRKRGQMDDNAMKAPRWYIAELVIRFDVEGASKAMVHINARLIRATSPGEAYDRALVLGREEEAAYTNTDGRRVRATFRGLRDLLGVVDALEDGSELYYEEQEDMTDAEVDTLVKPRHLLAVFMPDSGRDGL